MEELINTGNTATEVVTALSEYGDFSADMSATEFVEEVNTAFPDADVSVNDSATTLVSKINNAKAPASDMKVLKFLHVSDTHGRTDSITEAVAQMTADNDILALIHTGDILGNVFDSIANNKTTLKPLSVIGNHDAVDKFGRNRPNMRKGMEGINDGVSWGCMEQITEGGEPYYHGCYWSKDFFINDSQTRKLRVIGIDQYDYTMVDGALDAGGSTYTNVVSQEQVDWLIGRLTSLSPNDYFIICMHDTPWVCGPSHRRQNDWCSSRLYYWGVSYLNVLLFPQIVKAYTQKEDRTNNPITGQDYSKKTTVTVDDDFSQGSPATFLCFLCGHEHSDWHDYHYETSYNDQLVFSIDTAQRGSGGDNSDIRLEDSTSGTRGSGSEYLRNCLSNSGNGVLMNLITLDFARKTITLSRIGQYKAVAHDTSKGLSGDSSDPNSNYSAVERTTITFPFKKTQS